MHFFLACAPAVSWPGGGLEIDDVHLMEVVATPAGL